MDTLNLPARSASPSRWFEDFRIGESFILPARTLTHAMSQAFAAASGEAHPLHTDPSYGRAQGLPDMPAHPLLVVAQTVGDAGLFLYMVEEALVGMVEQYARFFRPVYSGDTLTPMLQVTETVPDHFNGVIGLRSTLHNQRRELVMEGTQRWLLRKRSP
jgi:acyl dehydratase